MISKKASDLKVMTSRFIQFGLIPVVLVGSDLFIGFMGHYSGSTGNTFSVDAFVDYVSHLTLSELIPTVIIALSVVCLVELVTRSRINQISKTK